MNLKKWGYGVEGRVNLKKWGYSVEGRVNLIMGIWHSVMGCVRIPPFWIAIHFLDILV